MKQTYIAKPPYICIPSSDCCSLIATPIEAPDLYSSLFKPRWESFSYMLLVSEDLVLGQELTSEELLMREHLVCLISFLKLKATDKLKIKYLILLWRPCSLLSSSPYWACPLKPSLPNNGISGNHYVFRRVFIRPRIFFLLFQQSDIKITFHEVEDDCLLFLGSYCAVY